MQNRNRPTDINPNLRLPKERKEGDILGVGDYQIQTAMYKIDKQQGDIVHHREIKSFSHDNF